MKKLVLILTIVLVMTLVAVATAFAAPPVRETIEYDDTYELIWCGDDIGVGDFGISNHEVTTMRTDTFYDNDGKLSKVNGRFSGVDHLFVDGYLDKVVIGHFGYNWTSSADPRTGEFTFSHDRGNWWNLQIPGYGNVVHIAGLENYQYDEEWILEKAAGLWYEDVVLLCEYLAPPP